MEGVRDAAKPIGKMLRGDAEYDATVVMTSLQTFQEASLVFGDQFPAGSEALETSEAAPAIWEDRDGFMNAVTAIQTASARLVTASRTGDAEQIGAAMQGVRQTCGGCHGDFRGPAN